MNIRCLTYLSTALCALVLAGCGHDSNPLFGDDEGRWVSDIPFTYYVGSIEYTLSHDNRIYESANFLVFSDASSDDIKKQLSRTAEDSFQELKEAFDISSSAELGIVDQDSKMKIYANRYLSHIQQYFVYGFIIYSFDSPSLDPAYKGNYSYFVRHELMHVFQHLLGFQTQWV